MSIGLIILVVLCVALIWVYNSLVRRKNEYQNAFAQIDVQLHRRHDLIPNLVNTAQAYLDHEQDTLRSVTQARNQAVGALEALKHAPLSQANINAVAQSEGLLSKALGALQVNIEAYPELKADSTMQSLSEELSSTENRISFARQAYNDSVMSFNTFRQSFPTNVIAGMTGHTKDAPLLQLEDPVQMRKAPTVEFK